MFSAVTLGADMHFGVRWCSAGWVSEWYPEAKGWLWCSLRSVVVFTQVPGETDPAGIPGGQAQTLP